MAAGHARRRRLVVQLDVQWIVGTFRRLLQRMPARAPQIVGDLVRGDREQVRLQLAAIVVVGQAREKTDEAFLNDVLAGGQVFDAAMDEREQPTFIAGDEMLPGARVALADLLHEQTVAVGGHAPSVKQVDTEPKWKTRCGRALPIDINNCDYRLAYPVLGNERASHCRPKPYGDYFVACP